MTAKVFPMVMMMVMMVLIISLVISIALATLSYDYLNHSIPTALNPSSGGTSQEPTSELQSRP